MKSAPNHIFFFYEESKNSYSSLHFKSKPMASIACLEEDLW